jgi:transcriptional regulator of arginine metabolism
MALNKRNERQNAIRQIIREETLFTQRDLVNALKERGHVCTQATVSRDIAEMNLHKMPDGGYVLSEDLYLQRMISELVVDVNRAGNLVVIKASVGTASGVAAALDAAVLSGLLGSVAGDDTILVIAADDEQALAFEAMVSKIRRKQ